MTRVLLLASLLVSLAALASAGTICPTMVPPSPITSSTGCNEVITFDINGVPTIALTDAVPYDNIFSGGGDDQLIGVVNNSNGLVTSIQLSGLGIFGFEGDGICASSGGPTGGGTFLDPSFCNTSFDTSGYGPNGVTFNIVDNSNGTVFFDPGIPALVGIGFFSLEESPSVQGGITIGGAPEPASLALMGAGLSALYFIRRRCKA